MTCCIPEEMFSSCNALTEVIIPSTVTRIEKGAFRSCKKLGNTELPASLTYIGESAFYYAAMTSVTLPRRRDGNWRAQLLQHRRADGIQLRLNPSRPSAILPSMAAES